MGSRWVDAVVDSGVDLHCCTMTPRNPLEIAVSRIPTERRTVSIHGSTTAYWEYGPQDAEHTVVLVHGFRGTHHGLQTLVAALPEYRFLAPDLPGFGESSPLNGEHTLVSYASWLGEFLQVVDPDAKAIVLGHSFGSMVVANALNALAQRRIALVNPIARNALSGPDRILTALAIGYYRLGAMLPSKLGHALMASGVITRIMSEVMAVTKNRALRAWIHDQHRRYFSRFANRTVLLEAFRASVSDDVGSHADQFPRGTLLVAGELDAVAPVDDVRSLQKQMTGSELHIIHGVGHLVHYETPIALARILRAWL